MSFTEKLSGLMNFNQQPGPLDDQPFYVRFGIPVLAIFGAFLCVIFGLLNTVFSFITFNVYCVVGSILQIVVGFVVLALEATCCFTYIDHVTQTASWMREKPLYYKAGLYCAIVVLPMLMCFGISSLFSYALVFASGVLYGVVALGKKASLEDMRQTARSTSFLGSKTNTTAAAMAAANTAPTIPTNERAGIISNAQPFALSNAIATDSDV